MKWVKIERLKNPVKKLPKDHIAWLDGYVLDQADIPVYKLAGYDSMIDFYDMGNYFIARQYMVSDDWQEYSIYADYRLTLTEEAWKIIDALLKAPFTCIVKRDIYNRYTYNLITDHSVMIPQQPFKEPKAGRWFIDVSTAVGLSVSKEWSKTTIPFNTGPLYPLWVKAVDCWVERLKEELKNQPVGKLIETGYGYLHVGNIYLLKEKLLEYRFMDPDIAPHYSLHSSKQVSK